MLIFMKGRITKPLSNETTAALQDIWTDSTGIKPIPSFHPSPSSIKCILTQKKRMAHNNSKTYPPKNHVPNLFQNLSRPRSKPKQNLGPCNNGLHHKPDQSKRGVAQMAVPPPIPGVLFPPNNPPASHRSITSPSIGVASSRGKTTKPGDGRA